VTLAWLLAGAGPGHAAQFAPAVQFAVGDGVHALAAGDYDGDGATDILTASAGTHLRLARGDGRGGISEVVELDGAPLAHALDLTGDGLADLVNVQSAGERAEVVARVADGVGHFAAIVTSPGAPVAGPYVFTSGDVDGDGRDDLIVAAEDAGSGRHLWVAPGHGDGSFGSWWQAGETGATSSLVAVPDANGDGRLEVAGADEVGRVWISFSDDVLGFAPATARIVTASPSVLGPLVVGWFGARPALAVVDPSRSCIALLAVRAQVSEPPACFPTGGSVTGLTAADLDGDRDTDLVETLGNGTVGVLTARRGTLSAPVLLPLGIAAYASDPLAPDLNADGKPDIVAVVNLRSLAVLLNISAPAAVVPSPSIDFGSWPVGSASVSKRVLVTSTGDWPLSPTAARLEGAEAGDFEIAADLCRGRILPTGSRCAVLIRFVPSGVGGRSATLVMSASGTDASQTVLLRGTGVALGVGKT